ncbi:LacI family DNA-binding transcriptional regulator [Nakamurella lactea]|uniref:LacI family DNA-binding transcriptional regulator n=1 Tax=Nakamurella lactea TaxID=459515 RepID=UPI0004251EFB|nr:LacI family DNA-binding transcriptional regulator [Nakamurella lactea]
MRITIADVAARAGVSKTTVSRVLNSKGELDQVTASRVRQVIEELGYVPSSGAVGLARGRTDVVGVLIPSLTWPWMGEMLQGVIDAVEAAGRGVMLFTCNQGDASMRRFASQVSARSFDGLVVIEPEGTTDYIAGLHANGLPVVMIDDRARQPGFPSVATTNYAGAASAARHLFGSGRRRPLVIRGSEQFGCTVERLQGFADVYTGEGLSVEPELVLDGEFTLAGGVRAVEQVVADRLPFDAVFAHNDLSAAGAIRALLAAGRRIPDDVAVVGFDDVPLAEVTVPTLSSVHQPLREMGEAAAQMLMSFVNGTTVPHSRHVIPTTLIIRESS